MQSLEHSSCRCGTAKRVGVAARWLVSAFLVAGCNFTDFSKTSAPEIDAGPFAEPACLNSGSLGDAGVTPVAHWTFNRSVEDGQWLQDDLNAHPLVAAADDADAGVAAPAKYPRINGEGQSLMLDGHQFLRGDPTTVGDRFDELYGDSANGQFTLSAWISVPARAFTSDGSSITWPILSTLSDNQNCNGYQIDLRFQKPSTDSDWATSKPELVLSYQSLGSECTLLSLHAPLDVPSWATGIGRWHHVAGTRAKVGPDRWQLALYWDGNLVRQQDPFVPLEATSSSGGERALYIGASATNATSAEQTKFREYIDDVAIFDKPLTEQQLADFVLESTTRPGPSNCRWRASEQWDKATAFDASYTEWSPLSTPEALSATIRDHDWGAGALDARILPIRNLQGYDKARLRATIPSDKAFQFTLASGDSYCTWVYMGKGKGTYEIDLHHPVNCVSSDCGFDFKQVDRASVTSEWAIPADSAGDAVVPGKRAEGDEPLTVTGLEFVPATGTREDFTAYGGVEGPLGHCWRLQAYEPESSAQWSQREDVTWGNSVSASLVGERFSGARVVADFGDRPLDISNCTDIVVQHDLTPFDDTTQSYAFIIQDEVGSWRSYLVGSKATSTTVKLDSDANASSDGSSPNSLPTSNFDKFPKWHGDSTSGLNFRKIRLLGIQKPWGFSGRVTVNVTVKGMQFNNNGSPNCERAGVN